MIGSPGKVKTITFLPEIITTLEDAARAHEDPYWNTLAKWLPEHDFTVEHCSDLTITEDGKMLRFLPPDNMDMSAWTMPLDRIAGIADWGYTTTKEGLGA